MGGAEQIDAAGAAWRLVATMALVLANGFFVATEFALVKVRRSRIGELAAQGGMAAKSARHLLQHLDHYLSACQLGITLASLVLGALGEPAVARLLVAGAGEMGIELDPSQPAVRIAALVVAFTVITILHMTLGEQAPKMWALRRSEATTLWTAIPLRSFALLLWPFIWLINAISNAMLSLVGIRGDHGHDAVPTAREIRATLRQAVRAGNVPERAQELIDNVFRMLEMRVGHIMVPRVDVTFLLRGADQEEIEQTLRQTHHTRFPVCDGDLDSTVGMVHAKDITEQRTADGMLQLSDVLREVIVVPETRSLARAMALLQRRGDHAAMVIDEHGTIVGMVFLEDAIEQVVGPIIDEFDVPRKDLVEVSPGTIELNAAMPLPEAADRLDLDLADAAENTIGGHIMTRLGGLPSIGDRVEVGDYMATVLELTPRRVAKRLRFELLDQEEGGDTG